MEPPWIAVVETESFCRSASGVLTADEIDLLIAYLAVHPTAGTVVPGSGGIRKLRWQAKRKGKRSGARVIYYFRSRSIPLYLLFIYSKDRKSDLSPAEIGMFRQFVEKL
jgi:hypothetical protein